VRAVLRVLGLLVAVAATGCGGTRTVTTVETVNVTTTRTFTTSVVRTRTVIGDPTVYVETPNGVQYKPTSINYLGGHQFVARIHWRTYGGDIAIGNAQWAADDCTPSCADGTYHYTPIKVRLMTREACHGVVAYRDWSLLGAKLDPTPQSITGSGCM
jgi:hypothetical protein